MGKFPGKPSKTSTRKRIKVSDCVTEQVNESVRAAQVIYNGLTVFNETFGNDEQVTDFRGFTDEQVKEAVENARNYHKRRKSTDDEDSDTVNCIDKFESDLKEIGFSAKCCDEEGKSDSFSIVVDSEKCFDGGGKRNSVIAVRRLKRLRKYDGRTRNPHSVKNVMARKLLRRAKKTSSTTPLAVDNCHQEKGASGASRKFVLPSHSAHSSRVIKPNKKFIDNDAVTSETSTGLSPPVDLKKCKSVSSESQNSEIPQSVKCLNSSCVENKQADSSDSDKTLCTLHTANVRRESASGSLVDSTGLILEGKRKWKPSYKLGLQLNWYGGTCDGDDIGKRRVKQDDNGENSACCEEGCTSPVITANTDSAASLVIRSEDKQISTLARSPGKVILRQARLKLNTQSSSVNDGPFSHGYGGGGGHLPETVECGVCGAVRFYRFVKQARKFGIFSCESCRKFISKMIKKQSSQKGVGNSLPLECHKGKGTCSVPPIVRSQQWKAGRGTLVRCNYKARCPACWLKLCLRSFKMPEDIRVRLQSLLPREMQDNVETMSGQLSLSPEETALPTADTRNESDYTSKRLRRRLKLQTLKMLKKDDSGKQNGNPKRKTSLTHARHSIRVSKFLRRASSGLNHMEDVTGDMNRKVITRKRKRRKYLLRRKKSDTGNEKSSEQRQRVDLKGPRVKHVCRSASIVLGQPQATFPTSKTNAHSKKRDAIRGQANPHHPDLPVADDDGRKSTDMQKHQPTAKSGVEEPDSAKSSLHGSSGMQEDGPPLLSSSSCRKVDKFLSTNLSMSRFGALPPAFGKNRSQETSHQMTIDFWESYDPDEVCNTGFALIASEPFQVRAVCFLCGSAGQEQLIHCASCCEPYHRFCLEDGLRDPNIKTFGGTSLSNWVCQRCTVCSVCGNGQGQQLSCQRCHRTYHIDCLSGRRLHSADRPWVCSTCLRCKSCGANNVTNFVGNIPLCKACFKLRQKGNYCPLCQRCYEDHDYDTKMMECAKCNCWVHSRCEGLSDEKYHILSYLPDTVEFICRKCCEKPPASWWYAVEEEMKAGYLTVLKLLSKNRKAYSMLRCSPTKHCEYHPNLGNSDNMNTHSDPTTTGNVCFPDKADSSCEDNTILSITDLHVENVEYSVEVKTTYEGDGNTECLANPKRDISTRDQRLSSRDYNFDGSCSEEKCCSHSQEQPVIPYLSETSLRLWREKYNLKECSVRVKDCVSKDLQNTLVPVKVDVQCTELPDTSGFDTTKSPSKVHQVSLATPTSDSGISSTDEELKICGGNDGEGLKGHPLSCLDFVSASRLLSLEQCTNSRSFENFTEASSKKMCTDNMTKEEFFECKCLENLRQKSSLTFLSVKNKVNSNEYTSVLQFHQEMEDILNKSHCSDLLQLYYHNMQEVFPWFNPKFARVSNNPVSEHNSQPRKRRRIISEKCSSDDHNSSMEVSILDDSFHSVPDKMLGKSLDDFYSGFSVQDNRICVLCKGVGDGLPAEEGRLLYCGQNEWAHTNCALWSAEVFEEIDGSLQNVHGAMSRGRLIRCDHCGKRGASVGCCTRNCPETFHFPCARKVNCTFMDDKNVFCPSHAKGATGKVLHHESDFEICRPIYVELDRKKKKFAEPKKVKLMIGSLSVENIGEFMSEVSDTSEAIIPNGFTCTRLFWSSVEPWRIVRYNIKTVLRSKNIPQSPDSGKNITVDHSQERHVVEEKLNEISKWKHEIKTNESKNLTDNPQFYVKMNSKFKRIPYRKYQNKRKCQSLDDKIVSQVVNYMLDIVSSKDVDETSLHDSQNAADLLPPELKEAIFEDLPHDLIDGISMQDILPKLMIYEDMGAMEKCDGFYGNDPSVIEKEIGSTDEASTLNNHPMGNTKKIGFLEMDEEDEDDLCYKTTISKRKSPENISLSKSNVRRAKRMKLRRTRLSNVADITPDDQTKRQKRSCSMTWNCKLDGNYTSGYKRRKLSHTVGRSVRDNPYVVIVDSDASHTLQELRIPECVHVTLSRSPPSSVSPTVKESPAELECGISEESPSDSSKTKVTLTKEEGKENKFLPWNGRPQTRFLQLDGTIDPLSSSGSEGGQSPRSDDEKLSDCAYEASSSSSRSCGQCQRCNSYINSGGNFGAVGNCNSSSSQPRGKSWYKTYDTEEEPVRCTQCRCTYRTKKSFERHLQTCCNDFMLSTSESDSENTRSSEEECTKKQLSDPTESCHGVSENVLEETNPTDVPTRNDSLECCAMPPQISPVLERLKSKSPSKFEVETISVEAPSTLIVDTDPHYQQHPCQGNSYVQVQSNQHSNAPAVIMQQVPSPSVVPTFIEAFQQQTGQSLQLVATIDAHTNGYTKQQFVSVNPVVAGNYPVQTPDNLVRLPLMPNVQSPAPHSAFLSTVIPPAQHNAVHCVSAEQTMIGCTPSLDMYGTQPGGMYLAGQPMYISNYETVVSNTVMSSSQLVSATLPGVVAASSSFSATTTQVFQASKLGSVLEVTLEPVVEVQPSYVIINQQTPISNSPVRNTEFLNCTPSNVSLQMPSYDHSFLPVQQMCTGDRSAQYPESSGPCTSLTLKTVVRSENRRRVIPEMTKMVTPRCGSTDVGTSHEMFRVMTPRCVNSGGHNCLEMSKVVTPRYTSNNVSTNSEFPKIVTPRRGSSSIRSESEFPRHVSSSVCSDSEFPKIITPRRVNSSFSSDSEYPKIITPRCVNSSVCSDSEFPKIITPRRVSSSVCSHSEFPKIITPRRVSSSVSSDSEFPKIVTPRCVSTGVNTPFYTSKNVTPKCISTNSDFPKIVTPRRVSNCADIDAEFPKIMTARCVSNSDTTDSEFPKIVTPRHVNNGINTHSEFPKIVTPRCVNTDVNTPYDTHRRVHSDGRTPFEMSKIVTPTHVSSGVNTGRPMSPVRNVCDCDRRAEKSQSDREECLIEAEQQLSDNSEHQILDTGLQSNTNVLINHRYSKSTKDDEQPCCSCEECYQHNFCCKCRRRMVAGGYIVTDIKMSECPIHCNEVSLSDISDRRILIIDEGPDHSPEEHTNCDEPQFVSNLPNQMARRSYSLPSKDFPCNKDESTFNTSVTKIVTRCPGYSVTEWTCKRQPSSNGKYKKITSRQNSPVNENQDDPPASEVNDSSVFVITDTDPHTKDRVNESCKKTAIKAKTSNSPDKISSSKSISLKDEKISTPRTNDESHISKQQDVSSVDAVRNDTLSEAACVNRDRGEDVGCPSGISSDNSPERNVSSEYINSVSHPQCDEQCMSRLHTQANFPEEKKSVCTCNIIPQVNAAVSVCSSDPGKDRLGSPLTKDDRDGSSSGGDSGRSTTNNVSSNCTDISVEDNAGDTDCGFGAPSNRNTGGSVEKDSRQDRDGGDTQKNIDDSGTNGYNDEEDEDTECCEDDDEDEEEENGDNDCDEEDENEDDSVEEEDNGDDSIDVSPVYCNGENSEEKSSYIMYEIVSQDGFCCTSKSFSEAWQKVFEAVQNARIINKMPPLPQNPFSLKEKSLQMLGLKHNAFKYLVEQLPGVGRCVKYKPRYHKQRISRPEDDLDTLPPPNKSGCIRTEPFKSRGPYDMFSWLASSHRNPPKFVQQNDSELMSNRRATSSNLPMAMRFRHLKGTNPNKAVGVYQSHIHGRGLFCLRDIESGEMVIEYAGEVIRSTLTDKREKLYESKGIGCYMFRIDDQLVVDATMRGNAARFINHSCDPNCYSRVVDILGKKHILIFALRRIPQGEELTYDYKFPFEDVKIPCTCGSRKCRKYLN